MISTTDERKTRREMFKRLAAEDLVALDNLLLEYLALKTGNPLTADRIKITVFRIADAMNTDTFPRGYRVLGGTPKTPHYLQMQDGSKPSDGQIVADAMSGWLMEIAEAMEQKLSGLRTVEEHKTKTVLSAAQIEADQENE